MKNQIVLIVCMTLALNACDSGKSVSKNLVTGLTARGDGLSCEDIYLSDGEEKINRNTFTYGENVYVNFENIEGFNKENGNAFPGMRLSVINQAGDTVMIYLDLYADYQSGINISPLLLQANLTVADPIHTGQEYTLNIYIWDKRGESTFNATMDFDVIPDKQIKVENNDLSYDEIYLFTKEGGNVIIGNEVNFNEDIYLIFEGLEGFLEEDGQVFIGLSLKVMDSTGEILIDEKDLIGDSGLQAPQVKYQLAPNFVIRDTDVSTPVLCEIVIWDKKSDSNIKASLNLNLR
ncbi:MAG: hypothetical protein V2I34_00555 [Bacteroidales bacterium]|jgi:hypothetical protein|nr:hypothetical protein [Bacteroidales bacterium]